MRNLAAGLVRFGIVLLLVAASPLVSGQAEEPEKTTQVRIARSAICLQVEEREPVEIDTVFRPDVGQVYAYTQVEGVSGPTQITHVWYHGEKEIFRRDLRIGGNGWRTWTSKKILPSWTGPWKVAVLDADGDPLKTLEFTVGEPAEPSEFED